MVLVVEVTVTFDEGESFDGTPGVIVIEVLYVTVM
jgi:hypothetical protein